MAQSLNSKVDLTIKATSFAGQSSNGNVMVGNKAFEFYKERFADAGDFTFVFVGNYDDRIMEDMIKKYIASLPGKASNEKSVDHKIAAPKGKFTKTIKKGVDEKASPKPENYRC